VSLSMIGCGGERRSNIFDEGNGPDGSADRGPGENVDAGFDRGGAVSVGGAGGADASGTGGAGDSDGGVAPAAGGTAGSGGVATGGGPSGTGGILDVPLRIIGAPCAANRDCDLGLFCLAQGGSDFAGGGPAHGVCSVDCSIEGMATCQAIDPSSRCVIVDDNGTPSANDDRAYCFPGCLLGDSGAGKCLGRPDLTCFESSVNPAAGFCQPVCNGDFECGNRACDHALGVCVDPAAITGLLPMGAPCDPSSPARQCAGACLQFSDGYSACSGFCNLGEAGCGSDPSSSDPIDAFCLLSVGDPDLYSIGDAGFCMELCDCDEQCAHPGALCDPFSASVVDALGRAGVCVPPELSANGIGVPCR
jgi:hypothetical protein